MTRQEMGTQLVSMRSHLRMEAWRLIRGQPRITLDDLIQDTWVRALGAAERFDGRNLPAWIAHVMRNVFLDLVDSWHFKNIKSGGCDGSRHGALSGFLWSDEISLQLRDVERAIACLSETSRQILQLAMNELNTKEMATILQVPTGTIKSRLSRARAQLQLSTGDDA